MFMKYVRTSSSPLRRILVFCGVFLLITCIIMYIGYQTRNLINGPSITLYDADSVAHSEHTVTIRGTTHNIVKLMVNGKEIYTDVHGAFEHMLVLEHGYSITRITAEDRFGRTVSVDRTYVYVPSQSPSS
jgi:hypothetical protein